MKLAPILAQYLYANKQLDLPGIGHFMFNGSPTEEQTSNSISFQSNPSTKESPELIAYISAQTGKMKALAAADLNSHLELIQQFLNIGKPFLLEGIGNLTKLRSGEYLFSASGIPAVIQKEQAARETAATSATEESFSSYEPLLTRNDHKLNWKKPALILMTLVSTGLAIWGGYTVYKKTTAKKEEINSTTTTLPAAVENNNAASPGTDSLLSTQDNTANKPPETLLPAAGHYKFVLETAGKTRALERYNKLKTYQWNVHLETRDSVQYKLFLFLQTSDTTRVLDSLTALNGRRVYIENNRN